jgi:GNAT superfamily N-acetyltransferase
MSEEHDWMIRPARRDDAEGIGIVHSSSQRAAYRGIMPDSALAKTTIEERTAWWNLALASHGDNWLNLVVESVSEIVGFSCTGPAGLSMGSTIAQYDLYFLYLLPGWERRGLGRALVHQTFSTLRARGVVDLQILCLSQTPALSFYEAMGGRVAETGHHEVDGWQIPHHIYLYDLADPAHS